MSPLRQKMIEAMRVRGYSPRTHQSYLGAVSALSKFYGRSPERLDVQALKDNPPIFNRRQKWSHAAMASFCRGVMPPMAVLGRSLL